jgi:hypothetical protein
VTLALVGSRSARADCKPEVPTGYLEGTATGRQAGELEVSLNLRCAEGRYKGELVTAVGTYSAEGGGFQGNHLRMQLGAGGDHVAIDVQLEAGMLRGTFVAGEDSGSIEVRRTGQPRASGSSIPALDLSSRP